MGTYREQLLARGGSTIFNARKLHQLVDTGGMGLCGIPREIVRCIPWLRDRLHVFVGMCTCILGVW